MPRSRRRQHSKSRSRTRSRSNDRDREPKRRKIESFDSPHQRKSVSSEPEAIEKTPPKIEQTANDVETIVGGDHQLLNLEGQNSEDISKENAISEISSSVETSPEKNLEGIISETSSDKTCPEGNVKGIISETSSDKTCPEGNVKGIISETSSDKTSPEKNVEAGRDKSRPAKIMEDSICKSSSSNVTKSPEKDREDKISKATSITVSGLEKDVEKGTSKTNLISDEISPENDSFEVIVLDKEDSPNKGTKINKSKVQSLNKDGGNPTKHGCASKSSSKPSKNDIRKYIPIKNKSVDSKENIADSSISKLDKSLSVSDDEDKLDKSFKSISENDKDSDDAMDVDEAPKSDDAADLQDCNMLDLDSSGVSKSDENISLVGLKANTLKITPKRTMSPRQTQRRLESEKKKAELESQKLARRAEKQKAKQERDDVRLKEKEEREKKRKELEEEKEKKRKEIEEKAEAKKKEKEQEKLKRQQELDEKNKEKNKLEEMKKKSEEQKKKTAAAFVNFFVPKKSSDTEIKDVEPVTTALFKPFKIKSDMRMAPLVRKHLTDDDKQSITDHILQQNLSKLYLAELKAGKIKLKSGKTWPYEDISDDVTIIEESGENLGETILEEKSKGEKMKAKYLKFHENQRPAYHGTWRKTSKFITAKTPLGLDKNVFNYEVDSDEEWEDEVEGESIVGSDDEDKENDSEVDNEYEVDNEFFVPHGHLSEDEGVDDEDEKEEDPENHQAKLTELKHVFDEERKSKTKKIKPRLIGCIWNKTDKHVKDAIDHYLEPLAMICNYPIIIKKRGDFDIKIRKRPMNKGLDKEVIPDFLRLIHGNQNGKRHLVTEFYEFLSRKKDLTAPITRIGISRQLKQMANWMKCPDDGPVFKKLCWYVGEDVRRDYNVNLTLPNQWEYITNIAKNLD